MINLTVLEKAGGDQLDGSCEKLIINTAKDQRNILHAKNKKY